MNGPQWTAARLAKGHISNKYKSSRQEFCKMSDKTHTNSQKHGQCAILSLIGSQKLCQTTDYLIDKDPELTLGQIWGCSMYYMNTQRQTN